MVYYEKNNYILRRIYIMVKSVDLLVMHKLAKQIEDRGMELRILVEKEMKTPNPIFLKDYHSKICRLKEAMDRIQVMNIDPEGLNDKEES